ncbi:hypothetical protein [Mariniblastus fucicola]|uniref:Uncharacterized protein n=1 Tax=Mariniblastus fucicola TaxID=980251 RepID=A0A5B9P6W0_9BACT|nr:hypothetical protein [Mariniblastus fucicola]QEG20915.1 hypothetical protein MFFC18_07660 [Mariniblastus fucicola]
MTTELSSAKYLPAEYNEPEVPVASEASLNSQASYSPGNPYTAQTQRQSSTTMLTVIACLLGLFGVVGIMGGAFGALGQVTISNLDASQISAGMGEQAEVYRRSIETTKQFSTVIYLHNGICALVGLGFIVSCAMLLTRREDANSFASTICIAAIFYNCLTVVVTWVTLPSFEGIRGMPEGAATMATGFAVGFAVIGALIKLGVYGFIISYLSKPGIKAIFEKPETIEPEATVA